MGYNVVVRWLGLVVLLAGCGQDESYFQDPTPKNLAKNPPYDFASTKYPRDLSGLVPDDLSVALDLGPDEGTRMDGGIDEGIPKPDLQHPDAG
jgi:hypothetical protein